MLKGEKRRQESVGSEAVEPDDLENIKEAGESTRHSGLKKN